MIYRDVTHETERRKRRQPHHKYDPRDGSTRYSTVLSAHQGSMTRMIMMCNKLNSTLWVLPGNRARHEQATNRTSSVLKLAKGCSIQTKGRNRDSKSGAFVL